MKRTALMFSLIVLIVFVSTTLYQQEPQTPDFVTTTIPIIEMAKTHTLEVAEAMPEDKYTYKPADVSRTFGEQIGHIAYTLSFFSKTMLNGEQIKYSEPDVSTMSKAELKILLEQGFDDFIDAVNGLSAEELEAEVTFFGDKKISKQQVILFAQDHCTNHRAKANLYIRMNDIDPPGYKFL